MRQGRGKMQRMLARATADLEHPRAIGKMQREAIQDRLLVALAGFGARQGCHCSAAAGAARANSHSDALDSAGWKR